MQKLEIKVNRGVLKCLEKNNFKKEAHFKEHSLKDGKYLDETVYSLIVK